MIVPAHLLVRVARPATYPARRLLEPRVVALLGSNRFPQERYDAPAGDPGLFGPDSATWHVHGDASMIVGGVCALMLQTLHPLAMAGVAEHSDYRERPVERLSRTSSFVSATTFAATPVAASVIDSVRAVHTRVRGIAPDGRAYRADDPDLLRWVHVTEVASFLRAHRRYHPRPLRGDAPDSYLDEVAVVAEMLGATDVPRSREEVRAYLRSVRDELAAREQALDTVRFLVNSRGGDPLVDAGYAVVVQAAIGLLPDWARGMLGLRQSPVLERTVVRPAACALLTTLRLAMGTPPAIRESRRRCG